MSKRSSRRHGEAGGGGMGAPIVVAGPEVPLDGSHKSDKKRSSERRHGEAEVHHVHRRHAKHHGQQHHHQQPQHAVQPQVHSREVRHHHRHGHGSEERRHRREEALKALPPGLPVSPLVHEKFAPVLAAQHAAAAALAAAKAMPPAPSTTTTIVPRAASAPSSRHPAAVIAAAKGALSGSSGSNGDSKTDGVAVAGIQVGFPFGSYPVELTTQAAQNLSVTGVTSTVFVGSANDGSIAANPRDPRHLIAVWQQQIINNGGAFFVGTGVSTNGGFSWRDSYARFPSSIVVGRISQPRVAISADGRTAYLVVTYFNTQLAPQNGLNQGGVAAFFSRDGGRSWIFRAIITSPNFGFPGQPNASMPLDYTDASAFIGASFVTPDPYDAKRVYAAFDLYPNADFFHSDAWFAISRDAGRNWFYQLAYNPFADPNLVSNGIYNDVQLAGVRVVVPKFACPVVAAEAARYAATLENKKRLKLKRAAKLASAKAEAKEEKSKDALLQDNKNKDGDKKKKKKSKSKNKDGEKKLGGSGWIEEDDDDCWEDEDDCTDTEDDCTDDDDNDDCDSDDDAAIDHTNLAIVTARIYAAPGATSEQYLDDSLPFDFTRSDIVVVPRVPPPAPGSLPQWQQESYVAWPNVTVANVYTLGYTYSGTNPPPGAITGGTGTLTGGQGFLVRTGTGGGANGNLLYGFTISKKTGAWYISAPLPRAGDSLQQIGLIWSKDGGRTWSTPVQVNRTPQTAYNPQAFTSSLAADDNGLIAVEYKDFRNDVPGSRALTNAWRDVYRELPGGGIDPVAGFVQEFNVGPNGGAPFPLVDGVPPLETTLGLAATGDYSTVISPSPGVFASIISASINATVTNPPVLIYTDPLTSTEVEADINYRSQVYFSRARVTNGGGGGGGCAGCAGCGACGTGTCPPGATCITVNASNSSGGRGSSSHGGGGSSHGGGQYIVRGNGPAVVNGRPAGVAAAAAPGAKCDNCIPR